MSNRKDGGLTRDDTTDALLVKLDAGNTNTVTVTGSVDSSQQSTASQPGTAVTVAVTNTVVAAANASRKQIDVVNDSGNTAYLRLAATGATMNSGIRLNANGGSWTSTRYTGAVAGIASANSNVTVAEV